jgi:hypothetical protein
MDVRKALEEVRSAVCAAGRNIMGVYCYRMELRVALKGIERSRWAGN